MTSTAELIRTLTVYALPLLFAITFHEAAHAYVAKFFGDTTAYSQGRMSLNPAKHIDPFGTIVLPIVTYFLTKGAFPIGYARPVPIDFGKLRKPKRDMAWVALAGPGANFVMALLWNVFYLVLRATQVNEEFFLQMAGAGVMVNLALMALNLFPIPPLDGGRVVTSILPSKYAWKFAQLEPYGFFIVLLLAMLNVLYFWMSPVMNVAGFAIQMIALPIKFLLY